jgi:hypothetical protein
MGNCILDLMIDTWRIQALQRICKAYKPSVSLKFVSDSLAFESIDIAMEFLNKAKCIITSSGNGNSSEALNQSESSLEINTKDTVLDMTGVAKKHTLL